MSAATNVGGTVYFKAGGKTLSAEGSITVDLSAFEREEKVGMDGEVHYTETPVAPFIEGTFFLNKSADPNEIAAMVDVTVKVELGSGRTGTQRRGRSRASGSASKACGIRRPPDLPRDNPLLEE